MSSPFIHLRVHSDFSMMDGLNKVKPILGKVAALGMPAVAITDDLRGVPRFVCTPSAM